MTGEGRDFEYDENIEADETVFEADESDESDETLEAFESEYYEMDESDESDEAAESFEASDEGEAFAEAEAESDEDISEAVMSASARLRRTQAQRRQELWKQKIASDQRLEVQRAAAAQRAITKQIQAVQPGGQTKLYSVPPLKGAGVVTAILPNGRRSQMRIIPTVAPVSEVNRLRAVIQANDKRQARATVNNSRAISALARAQTAAVKKLTAEQVKSDRELRKRLVEGDNRLDQRITKELSGGSGVFERHGKAMVQSLRAQRRRSIANSVLLATAAPFFSAYGDRGDPFGYNNRVLTASLAGWLLAPEALDLAAGKSKGMKTFSNWLSYGAFAGNGATAYFLLKDRQHHRLISGITEVTGEGPHLISLTNDEKLIAKDAQADFKKNSHTVVASTLSGTWDVHAEIVGGDLKLTVPGLANDRKTVVGWVLDTDPEARVLVTSAAAAATTSTATSSTTSTPATPVAGGGGGGGA